MAGRSCSATGKAAWPSRCLAPQLVPSWTSSERPFEQCVSPSPPGKRGRPGKSIARQSVGRWVKRIAQGWAGELGQRPRPGAARVGRVRSTAQRQRPAPSQVAGSDYPPSRTRKRASWEGASKVLLQARTLGLIQAARGKEERASLEGALYGGARMGKVHVLAERPVLAGRAGG